jgi:phosphate transport system substrate-binding protein
MHVAFRGRTLCAAAILCASVGCTIETAPKPGSGKSSGGSTGDTLIEVDGSSTVAPISFAVAEIFEDEHPEASIKVNVSGTGGGFERFAKGETDISNASRPIKPGEVELCEKNGVEFAEIKVGMDGLTVVVNPDNDWCDALTVEQLADMWKKESPVQKWSDINPEWPDQEIKLFGPDSKSGTYDYFKEETVGKDNPVRNDYQPNTDDNVLVTGVAGDKYALGFFGYAYFVENEGKLKPVAIAPEGKEASAAVLPTQESIEDGSYTPLSRPLFIYVSLKSMQDEAVRGFAQFHISDEGQDLVKHQKYVPLNAEQLAESRAKLKEVLAHLGDAD